MKLPKPDLKGFYKSHKKAVLAAISLVLAASIGCGIWYYVGHNASEPVYVFPFEYIGMTEYWGDSQESYGPVSTEDIQTVFLSDTQTVTDILVEVGDTVKKGDLLMTFDTTLSDLALEKKRLDVEKMKLQLLDAQERLYEINSMIPMEEVDYGDEESYQEPEDLGAAIYGTHQIHQGLDYDGSSKSNPLICWLAAGTALDDAIIADLWDTAEALQTENAQIRAELEAENQPAEGEEPAPEPPGAEVEPVTVSQFYVVIRITQEDCVLGVRQVWQGLRIAPESGSIWFFDASGISDPMVAEDPYYEDEAYPEFNYSSGYTAAQIAQMRSEQEKKIKELEFNVKMVEAEYKIMVAEANDGNVYSDIDGEVVSVLTEEEAKASKQPVLKVSAGGGFYIEGFVNELEKDKLVIGQEVTVNDWNTGMTYTGKIAAKGDFPTDEGYFTGMGNPNASYYSFRAFVDGSADLQEGRYVSVMYSTSQGENGVYLENPFLRTEGGRSYVMVQGADGLLEQRYVVTGKSLWGSYTEIVSGLTPEDLIAFPYGKEAKPGARTQEGDMSNLYE